MHGAVGTYLTGSRRVVYGVAVAVLLAAFFSSAAAPATAATGSFTFDPTNREQVRQLWYTAHEVNAGPIGWTGSIAGCNPGTVNSAYLDATLTRTNYFRAMAGVPSNVTFTAANNTEAQAAALMMSAQGDLSHDPPNNWACWTQLGHDGAATSNLSLGNTGPDSIDALMRDGGVLGHRRNMLNPQALEMGSGSVPASAGKSAAEAQLLGAQSGTTQPARDTFVAWPPRGFVPYQAVYPRWSFILRGADFTNANVTMTSGGNPMAVSIQDKTTDFSGPGIVWLANGLTDAGSWPKPASDQSITVTVSNVTVNGVPGQSFTYTTTVIDPADADPAHTPLTITGPAQPVLNQANAYSVNDIPNATGYQWRTTRLSSLTLNDGAEGGLTNFDANVASSYSAASTAFAATGTHSFQLDVGNTADTFADQTLTLKKTLVPTATSQLTFKTHAEALDNIKAVVEISPDDGATWQTLYTEANTSDAGFVNRSASLASFAGQHIKLRLHASYGGGSISLGDSIGWFVDDLNFANFLTSDAPVLSTLSASKGFSFTPTQAGDYDINVHANFFGSGFGGWSPTKRVTTTGGATLTLATALDNSVLSFSSDGDKAWTAQTAVSHDGVDAAKSGAITDNQSSNLITTVTGPTKLRFWWKSDSEANFDFLKVTVDGVEPFAGISGNVDWQQKKISLTAGPHTIKWTYSKDASMSSGADAAWVDQVTTAAK